MSDSADHDRFVTEYSAPSGRRWSAAQIALGFLALVAAVSLCSAIFNAPRKAAVCPECNCGDPDTTAGVPRKSDTISETTMGLGLSVLVITVVTCVLASHFMAEHDFDALPDCIAYVLIGVLVGSVIRLAGASAAAGYALPNQEQLFLFILPPIIFEAGYSLNKREFFLQWGSILVFAVIGTLVSALVFGVGLFLLGMLPMSYGFSLWDALKFGALISAVDPVATIAVFSALKVNNTLHFLVFGESVLNDAVAIVLYRTFSDLGGADKHSFMAPMVSFVVMFFGSTVIGIVTACLAALVLKHSNLRSSHTLEMSFYVLMAYLPYFVCEGLGMSGIMGILASGVTLAHYAVYNLSKTSQLASHESFRMLSFICETFLFVYLGTALTTFKHRWHLMTVVWGVLLTLISRAFNVFPISAVLNQYRQQRISLKNQLIMWFSGLRGAIAFALSLNFSSIHDDTRKVVVSTTLAIVLFTVIVLGGGTMPLLRLLRVEGASASPPDAVGFPRESSRTPKLSHHLDVEESESAAESNGFGENGATEAHVAGSALWFMRLDAEWMRPALIVDTDLSGASNEGPATHQGSTDLDRDALELGARESASARHTAGTKAANGERNGGSFILE
eukprot:CAMPEP_0185837592 /NCGR_PEP_ID=MMETSP1353-20130828/11644_1 /TAXON_ID=1077150 /ORGANISM="Erythrolobus australicus, Strain CCMP3124" /LENGTH=618 /DNA_ID=CAMNT_0028536529 /DNA_START=262 /DNA_END=2118 /DNA_ORIENTATION=+